MKIICGGIKSTIQVKLFLIIIALLINSGILHENLITTYVRMYRTVIIELSQNSNTKPSKISIFQM